MAMTQVIIATPIWSFSYSKLGATTGVLPCFQVPAVNPNTLKRPDTASSAESCGTPDFSSSLCGNFVSSDDHSAVPLPAEPRARADVRAVARSCPVAPSLRGHAQRECDEVGDVTAGVGNCQVRRLGVCHKESNGIECEVLDSKGADLQFWKQDGFV